MIDELQMFGRYAVGLRPFLRTPISSTEQAKQRVLRQRAVRVSSFLAILRRAIFANPVSPYRRLLEQARISFDDVEKLVAEHGLEGALGRLYDAGVYVTLNEFKGRQPISRGSLEIPVTAKTFDNPLLSRHYEVQSSGSRGVASRVIIDLELLTHEAAYYHLFLTAFDLWRRPLAIWRAVPPVSSGIKGLLRFAKAGKPVDVWFAQSKPSLSPSQLKFYVFMNYTIHAGRIFGSPMPTPEFVSQDRAHEIAAWLAARRNDGTPAFLETSASSAVRICAAAMEHRLDISGSFFRFGGEPFTSGKAAVITRAGCSGAGHYNMSEIGTLGMACATPQALDDVHIMTDKIAVIQRAKPKGPRNALVYSTVLPSCPKLMLNVESDDYGNLEERECGCVFGALGCTLHLTQIRSYEKLTSEGVSFLGTDLLRLVEEVLPARFGGYPSDYQLVEAEHEGLPRVSLVISPRVGRLDETEVLTEVFSALSRYPAGVLMAEQWRQARTLRVVRSEPYATHSAKIHPLHVVYSATPIR